MIEREDDPVGTVQSICTDPNVSWGIKDIKSLKIQTDRLIPVIKTEISF